MLYIILLLIIAGLCFAYLRSTQQTKSAQDDAKCLALLNKMYAKWYMESYDKNYDLEGKLADAYLSIEVMALGLEQERRDHAAMLTTLLNQKEPA